MKNPESMSREELLNWCEQNLDNFPRESFEKDNDTRRVEIEMRRLYALHTGQTVWYHHNDHGELSGYHHESYEEATELEKRIELFRASLLN